MNLVKEILYEHSKTQKNKIVRYVVNDAKCFAKLVDIFLAGPPRISQHAAWPISYCIEQKPELIKPHLKKLLIRLEKKGQHDSVKRNLVRLLQFIDIPKSLQGKTVNICFDFLNNPKEPIAVRAFSMTVLANLVKENPDLKNEIITVIEDQLPFGSAGFRSRARKVLKELKG